MILIELVSLADLIYNGLQLRLECLLLPLFDDLRVHMILVVAGSDTVGQVITALVSVQFSIDL